MVVLMTGIDGWHNSFSSYLLLSILNLNIMPRSEAALSELEAIVIKKRPRKLQKYLLTLILIDLLTNNKDQPLILLYKKNKPLRKTFNSDFVLLFQIHYYIRTVVLVFSLVIRYLYTSQNHNPNKSVHSTILLTTFPIFYITFP